MQELKEWVDIWGAVGAGSCAGMLQRKSRGLQLKIITITTGRKSTEENLKVKGNGKHSSNNITAFTYLL